MAGSRILSTHLDLPNSVFSEVPHKNANRRFVVVERNGPLVFRVRSSGRKNMDKPAIHTLALAREALFTLCVEIQRTGGSPADAIRLSEAMARVRSAERRLKKERVRADIAIPDDEHTRF